MLKGSLIMDDVKTRAMYRMLSGIIDVGIFSLVVWLSRFATSQIWLLYAGWCVGCVGVYVWKTLAIK